MLKKEKPVVVKNTRPQTYNDTLTYQTREMSVMNYALSIVIFMVGIVVGMFLNGKTSLLNDLQKSTPDSVVGSAASYLSCNNPDLEILNTTLADMDEVLDDTYHELKNLDYSERLKRIDNDIDILSLRCNTDLQ